MIPTYTRDANRNFHAPENWNTETDGVCNILQCRVSEDYGQRGLVNVVSTWKPDAAELAHLIRGGVIELSCIGSQPPCLLYVVDPVEIAVVIPERKPLTINEEAHGHG